MDLQQALEISCRDHNHLCPRQVLGARIGLAGLRGLGYVDAPGGKRLLVIVTVISFSPASSGRVIA